MILSQIRIARLIPVVVIDDVADAIPLCQALSAGGLKVAELTFRTPAAKDAIRLISKEFPDFLVGAGTITTLDELSAAQDAGAKFAVAPGTNPTIVKAAQAANLPFFPGIATPSEVERALDLGCTTLKFFPASQMGGPAMLNTLAAVYGHRNIQFIPTGGINEQNALDYLNAKRVLAIGGSWMVAPALIKAKQFDQIAALTRAAMEKLNPTQP